jgi:hypothetical protein
VPLSQLDQDRIKFHLGYTSASTAAALQYGFAIPLQTLFLLDSAMNQMPEIAIPRVLSILGIMDNIIFGKLVDSQDYLAAERLGEMTLRPAIRGQTHPDLLRRELRFYASTLADTFGVPYYPFSERFIPGAMGGAGNGRVTR